MTDRSTFYEGNTLTVQASELPITGRIVHLSARRLELALLQPYGWLFHLSRPAYFSRFLLGDGFLGPDGEPFAREMIVKLHHAAEYLHQHLPLVAEALRADVRHCDSFLRHLDRFTDLKGPFNPATLRATTLRIEQELTPSKMHEWPALRWQQPFLTGLLEVQANVLLHRWLREGPFDIRNAPTRSPSPGSGADRSLPSSVN